MPALVGSDSGSDSLKFILEMGLNMLAPGSGIVRLHLLFVLQDGGHILLPLIAAVAAVDRRKDKRRASVATVEPLARQSALKGFYSPHLPRFPRQERQPVRTRRRLGIEYDDDDGG